MHYMKDDLVSKMIEDLDKRVTFGGFDQNQIRDISQDIWDEIISKVVIYRGGNGEEFEDIYVDIGVNIRRAQVYSWYGAMHLLPYIC